jgi:hypothetical protein
MSSTRRQWVGSGGRLSAALAASLLVILSAATPAGAKSSPPHLRISPSAGPIGTQITLSGHLTPSERSVDAKADDVWLFITAGRHAGLETSLRGRLTIASDGAMTLTFTLPLHSDWITNPMTGGTDRLAQTPSPTVLEVAWPCRACGIGTFDVTAPATSLPFTGGSERSLLVPAALLILAGCAATAAAGRRRS